MKLRRSLAWAPIALFGGLCGCNRGPATPAFTPGLGKIMTDPLQQVEKAIAAHDGSTFNQAFDGLTEACNSCHRATNFGFNVVTRPSANPYSNQSFQLPQ